MEAAQKAPQSPPGETKPLEVLIHNVSHKDLLMTVCRAEHASGDGELCRRAKPAFSSFAPISKAIYRLLDPSAGGTVAPSLGHHGAAAAAAAHPHRLCSAQQPKANRACVMMVAWIVQVRCGGGGGSRDAEQQNKEAARQNQSAVVSREKIRGAISNKAPTSASIISKK